MILTYRFLRMLNVNKFIDMILLFAEFHLLLFPESYESSCREADLIIDE